MTRLTPQPCQPHMCGAGVWPVIAPEGRRSVAAGGAQRNPWTIYGRPGTILIVTMVLVFALAAITLVLCRSMRVEIIASANYTAAMQATAIERGAERYLLAMLTQQGGDLTDVTEDYFAGIAVGEGYFWVLRPDYQDTSLPVFGLVGESSKLNINTATFEQLMILPWMTQEIASSILDWRDEDDNPNQNGGAESDHYLSLTDGYYCKNAPFETVEELLLVRGMLPEILYGAGETLPLGLEPTFTSGGLFDTQDIWLEKGLYDLLTIYGTEPSTAADGTQKIRLSDTTQLTQLRELLETQFGTSRGGEIAQAIGSSPLVDIFDLYFRGKLTPAELSAIEPYIAVGNTGAAPGGGTGTTGGGTSGTSTSSTAATAGRINVNQSPREVLLTLTNLSEGDVESLITQRHNLDPSDPYNIAWVADALGQKAIGLGTRLTGRSYQYSALILAVSGNGRAFKQVRIVIDVSGTTPLVVYRKDLTNRGWPMDPEILASLRAGQGLAAGTPAFGSRLGGLMR